MQVFAIKKKIQNLLKKTFNPILEKINQSINKNSVAENILINLSHQSLKRRYNKDEKIDIVFIFQSASFWASWESVWDACQEDSRINPIMLVSDDAFSEKKQFLTAQSFLKEKNISFQHVSEVNLSDINPHIVVLHTPYDGHRPRYLHAKVLSSRGYRVVYITYGIEISDINKARSDHFCGGVTINSWRLYTFSKEMIPDYKIFSPVGGDMVRSFGHPKFDYLNKKCFPELPIEIQNQVKGRKVVLWKVHFPKIVAGKMITPSLNTYEILLKNIKKYKNLFFIFMPHPKFYEQLEKFQDIQVYIDTFSKEENIVEYLEDDYRQVLVNCDYYIMDRSALMIEAGVAGKPILYVNAEVSEPLTKPVEKIINSYYQASTFDEIKLFLDNIVLGDTDPLKKDRISVFKSVILNMDGKSGYRIKEDMVESLQKDL